jgi:hypothetical protein
MSLESNKKDRTNPKDRFYSGTGWTGLTGWTFLPHSKNFGFLTSLSKSLWVLRTLALSRLPCCISFYSTATYTQERNKTLKNKLELVNLILFFLQFFIFVKAWGYQHDLDLSYVALSRWQWIFLTYTIKTLLLVHVTLITWFNKYQHLELCDSPWLDWYFRLKHSLFILHHIWYLDVKSPSCSSSMYGLLRPSTCWYFFNHHHDSHASSCLQ